MARSRFHRTHIHTYVCTRCSSVNRKTRQDEVEHMKQQTQQQKQQHKNNNEKRQQRMFIDIALHYPSLSVSQLNLSFTLLHSLFLSHRTWGGCCCCVVACRPMYVCMYSLMRRCLCVCAVYLSRHATYNQTYIQTDIPTNAASAETEISKSYGPRNPKRRKLSQRPKTQPKRLETRSRESPSETETLAYRGSGPLRVENPL